MALSPLLPVPVRWSTSLVDLQPTSRGSVAWDTALVSTTLQLHAPAGTQLRAALAAAHELDAPPAMVLLPDAGSADFDPLGRDEAERLLTGYRSAGNAWRHAVEQAQGGLWYATLTTSEPDQLLHVMLVLRVEPRAGAPDVFDLRLLAPFASFPFEPGAPASLTVALPRLPDRLVTTHYGYVEDGEGEKVSSGTESEHADRRFVSHLWEHEDPLLRIRYAYSKSA